MYPKKSIDHTGYTDVTATAAPAMNLTIDNLTNRITTSGFTFDANGNQTASPLGTFHYRDGTSWTVPPVKY